MSMGYIDYLRNRENRENNETTKWISRSRFGIWMSLIVARIAVVFLCFFESTRSDDQRSDTIDGERGEERRGRHERRGSVYARLLT